MRTRTSWLAMLIMAGLALAPAGVRGQDVPPADPEIPLPLYHDRPETGGFYVAGEFVFFRQTNPLKHQLIAVRGILDFDGSILQDLNGVLVNPIGGPPIIIPGTVTPSGLIIPANVVNGLNPVATFIGSGQGALYADDAGGPGSYQPGWKLSLGWRFRSGVTADFSYMSLTEAKYSAVATLVPPGLNAGPLLADTFLFSPVYNFTPDWAGAEFKIALGNPNAAYGIWNGASVMSIDFVQRYDEYNINVRMPMFETDYCRSYGLIGPRHVSLWERFRWRTVSMDFDGQSGPRDVANYNNTVSNQMYGLYAGVGTEWFLGHGVAVTLDLKAALMVDVVQEISKYERGDKAIANKRALRDYTVVPELEGQFNVWWYPTAGIQMRAGYSLMTFFNTVAAEQPVSFNYGGLDPDWTRKFRYFDGFNAGIGFIF